MIPTWLEHIIGTGGAILVLAAYFLVSSGRVASLSVTFQSMNLVGAGLLTTYAVILGGWSLVFLNGVWGVVAIMALFKIYRERRQAAVRVTTS